MRMVTSNILPLSIAAETMADPTSYVILTADLQRVAMVVFPDAGVVADMKRDTTWELHEFEPRGRFELAVKREGRWFIVPLELSAEVAYAQGR